MYFRSIPNVLLHLLDVVLIDSLRVCQVLCNVNRNDNFVDGAVWIRGNDGSACEIYSLGGQIQSESSLLSLKTLTERSDGLVSQKVIWQPGCIAVVVLSDAIREQ